MAAVLRELVSLALVVGLIVTASAVLIILVGTGGPPRHRSRHRRRHDDPPPGSIHAAPPGPRPAPLATTPASAVAAARARAYAAAEQLVPLEPIEMPAGPEQLALPPGSDSAGSTSPAGQPSAEPDVPERRLDPSAEELRAAIDHLIETNPDFLAEVITKWIRSDSGTEATGQRPPSVARRPGARPRRP